MSTGPHAQPSSVFRAPGAAGAGAAGSGGGSGGGNGVREAASTQALVDVAGAIAALRTRIASVYLGNSSAIDSLLVCLLARGHCLIEDVPGVGKTLLASALARSLDVPFSRIQLTPDLLPSDILGVSVYRRDTGEFEFKQGPIFASIVLADEINRATPRTQSALLEAMNESAITVDGRTHPLGQPFMLIATQNPSDFEGTYLLPENQLDRFLMRITLGYPSPADEARVLELRPSNSPLHTLAPVMHGDDVLALQARTDAVRLDRSLVEYIIAFARATREHEAFQLGLSPRGALALAQASRATAVLDGRDFCVPEDILACLHAVVAHRVIPRAVPGGGIAGERGSAASVTTVARLLDEVIAALPSPA
ncbi:MAG: AAA family ATPase [Phycisphaerales bacterium]